MPPLQRAIAWALVIAVIGYFTLGKAHFSVEGLWDVSVHQRRVLRLVPLDEFRAPSTWYGPWLNFFGNVALFLPVGFLLGSAERGAVIGLILSVCIEAAQWIFASGYTDIDDVIFNTAGAALGGWLAAALSSRNNALGVWVISAGAAVLSLIFLASIVR
ncbi:VanZ family protein [Corynebacterium liangguodongii]|uniref:VanZ family protein n=1 Tax=Corynebacterium liangguodongii TaxID=2079535 RepID=UPI00131F36F9|nr:VanZ family protein [Corynebacterium liangguodongii]